MVIAADVMRKPHVWPRPHSKTAAIVRMIEDGGKTGNIAFALQCKPQYVSKIKGRWRERCGTEIVPVDFQVLIETPAISVALAREAKSRGLTPDALASLIVKTVALDRLFKAVLDD